MEIEKTRPEDLDRLMEIFETARAFMARTGNPRQWGPRKWPPRELLASDIERGKSYVCRHEGKVVGTFFYDFGQDIEPTYAVIEGNWANPAPYGVVHRIAADGTVKGTGRFCLDWAKKQAGHLRIDTHGDNKVMQHLVTSLGFEYRGIIYVTEDRDPRLAYEWTEEK